MKYNIYEIFYSIQGEGHNTGMPAIFIRFSGCNLSCDFCDEKASYKNGKNLSYEGIEKEILKYKQCKNIILTGGEPALQIDEEIIDRLKEKNFKIHIETNGTIEKLPSNIDWITVSPKKNLKLKKGNELKVVYTGQDLSQYESFNFEHFYLQPESNSNIEQCIDIIKKNPKWKLSIQLHKFLEIK